MEAKMNDFPLSLEMKSILKDPATKAAFVSDYDGTNGNVCQNCGGSGYVYIFVATAGPFKVCPTGAKIITHWDGMHYWIGETFSFCCPVCDPSAIHKHKTIPEEE
jgi:hypothetical protein